MDVNKQTEKPRVLLNKMSFNDGSSISLAEGSIVVFTGANNCGKSQVLRDIELIIDASNDLRGVVLSDCDLSYFGSIDNELFLDTFFTINDQGYYRKW